MNAQAQVAASQRDLIIAQTNVQYAELKLKSMISNNLDEPLASATIETTDSFPEPENDKLPALDRRSPSPKRTGRRFPSPKATSKASRMSAVSRQRPAAQRQRLSLC